MKFLPKTVSLSKGEQTRWVSPEGAKLDLLYLSWGRYGQGTHLLNHRGWIYAFVHKGARMLQLAKGAVRLPQLVIVDPACACGWGDASPGVPELLTWLWTTALHCAECTPPPGGFRLFSVDHSLRQKLKQIHLFCRGEVKNADRLTKLKIEQARLQLDLAIARHYQRLAFISTPVPIF